MIKSRDQTPDEYKWSSYRCNAWDEAQALITPHAIYDSLGSSATERCHYYRELFKIQLSEHDIHLIKNAAHYCQPVGDLRFKESIERQIGRKLGYAGRGRPEKNKTEIG